MFKRLIAAGLGIAAVITALPAQAQNCAQRDIVVERLQDQYSERLTAGGLHAATDKTTVVEVWSSPETGTFTVMLTNAQGMSCILATGTDWYAQDASAMTKGTPS